MTRIFFCQPWAASGPYTPTYPAAATLNQSHQVAPDMNTNDGIMVAAAHELQTTAGATGTAEWTTNMGRRADNVAVTLALMPA